MTEDDNDNSSWIFTNSSFEKKNWDKVRGANDDSEDPSVEITSVTVVPNGLTTGASKALNISSSESTTVKSQNIGGNDTTDNAVEALNLNGYVTVDNDAETAGKVLNISGNATTDEMTTDGESEQDATKSPEGDSHVLNTRGSAAGNTTDVMDILSDPERKKWPTEERVEGESPQEPVR